MDLVFIADRLESLQPGHDTTVALMEAAQRRGHQVLVTTMNELSAVGGRAAARCRAVTLRPAVLHDRTWVTDPSWYALDQELDLWLDDAGAVFVRTDPPVDADYLRATYVLDLVDPTRTLVVNSPRGLRDANEHLFSLITPELMPPTIVTADRQRIRDSLASWGRAVLKPTEGMAGRGIFLLDPADPNLGSILEVATERGAHHVLVQRWVDEVRDGDRRVIVVGGRPLGAVRRLAAAGEFRCNMATGASVVRDEVTDVDRRICQRLAPILADRGLHFVGIDVIGDRLTEINVTSPTGIREIDALSGTRLAEDVIEWAEGESPRAERCRIALP